MALSLEDAAQVRQKVYSTLGGVTNETANAQLYWKATRELFNILQRRGITKLQFVEFGDADATAGDGQDHGIDAAHQIYMVYCKKQGTSTASYLKVIDDADNDSEVPGDIRVTLGLLEANQEVVALYPGGLTMADGLVTTFATGASQDSATQSTAGDGGDGFYVIGA